MNQIDLPREAIFSIRPPQPFKKNSTGQFFLITIQVKVTTVRYSKRRWICFCLIFNVASPMQCNASSKSARMHCIFNYFWRCEKNPFTCNNVHVQVHVDVHVMPQKEVISCFTSCVTVLTVRYVDRSIDRFDSILTSHS